MPLTKKGRKILRAMKRHYGPKRGTRVFYASEADHRIRGVTVGGPRAHRRGRRRR